MSESNRQCAEVPDPSPIIDQWDALAAKKEGQFLLGRTYRDTVGAHFDCKNKLAAVWVDIQACLADIKKDNAAAAAEAEKQLKPVR